MQCQINVLQGRGGNIPLHSENGAVGMVPSAPRALTFLHYPDMKQLPGAQCSQLRCSWCTWLPSRTDKNVSVAERGRMQHGLCPKAPAHSERVAPHVPGVSSLSVSGHS